MESSALPYPLPHVSMSDIHTTGNSTAQVGPTFNFHQSSEETDHERFERLLSLLPYAAQAPFDASSQQDYASCLPNTRMTVLEELRQFVYGDGKQHILWLSGMAGTGKSTIMRTLAEELNQQKTLGASFFFRRGGGDVASASMLFTSIAHQLAGISSELKKLICDGIRQNPHIATKRRREQWTTLIQQPLEKLQQASSRDTLVIIVDALDECDSENEAIGIVGMLADARLSQRRFRIIVTSRPETSIRLGFRNMDAILHKDLVLHDRPREEVDADIHRFYRSQMHCLKEQRNELPAGWPAEEAIDQMVELASGLFIFARTLCRFMEDEDDPVEYLSSTLASKRRTTERRGCQTGTDGGFTISHLDGMYEEIVKKSLLKNEKTAMRDTLCAVTTLQGPLSVASLVSLVHHTSPHVVHKQLDSLQSVIFIPRDQALPFRLLHDTFRGFLLDSQRCTIPGLAVNAETSHLQLFRSCLRAMGAALQLNVCGLEQPGTVTVGIDRETIESCLPPHVQYACCYWVEHLLRSVSLAEGPQTEGSRGPRSYWSAMFQPFQSRVGFTETSTDAVAQLVTEVHTFLNSHLLYWLEAMTIISRLTEAIEAMVQLTEWLTSSGLAQRCMARHSSARTYSLLQQLVADALRFVHYGRAGFEAAPLQIYCSALLFAPARSIVRTKFADLVPDWVHLSPGGPHDWGACVQILRGHSDAVISLAVSADTHMLASGSEDGTARLWNKYSGRCLHSFEGHSEGVTEVAFSPDGQMLASSSRDGTVRLWETATGRGTHVLQGVNSAFSPDGQTVATASEDGSVTLWNVSTGRSMLVLGGHEDGVPLFAFSPRGEAIASASCGGSDAAIKIWDPSTGLVKRLLKGRLDVVKSLAFSPDGRTFASGGDGKSRGTIDIWHNDTSTWNHKRTMWTKEGWFDGLAMLFSPDGHTIATACASEGFWLWKWSPERVGRRSYGSHSIGFMGVRALAFSPNSAKLVVSSYRGSELRLLNSSIDDEERKLDDERHRFRGHSGVVRAVAFLSRDESSFASASEDTTVRLWDAKVEPLYTSMYPSGHMPLAFSPDGGKLAIADSFCKVEIWSVSRRCLHYRYALLDKSLRSMFPTLLVFSRDGRKLAMATTCREWSGCLFLWDSSWWSSPSYFRRRTSSIRHVVFSPDGLKLAMSWTDNTVRLWDTEIWKEVGCWPTSSSVSHSSTLRFSQDGCYLEVDGDKLPLQPATRPYAETDLNNELEREVNMAVSGDWIFWNSQPIIWIPPDLKRRLGKTACHNCKVAMLFPDDTLRLLSVNCSKLGQLFHTI